MVTPLLLAWALVVQMQTLRCQDGVCVPHPQVPARSQVVRTLESERDCLLLQMELQRMRQTVATPAPSRPTAYAQVRATFLCQPSP